MLLIPPALSGIISRSYGVDVADVFSTDLWVGTGASISITNGVDLSNEGGMTWIKKRDGTGSHRLFDTERGATKHISSNEITAETTTADTLTSFNSDGFTLGADASQKSVNGGGYTYAGWSFRKAPKFFDVVTYTGDGVAGREIAHSLGVAPGMMIVKRRNIGKDWCVYHRGPGKKFYQLLNGQATFKADFYDGRWNDTEPTASVFTLGIDSEVNAPNDTYVAYLFAHDTDTDGIIQCGSYTGNGSSTGPVINLGWKPQWLLVKATGLAESWIMYDAIRSGGDTLDDLLYPNTSEAESANQTSRSFEAQSTGFQAKGANSGINESSETYIYIAIKAE